MSNKTINIGLIGFGTVGAGVAKILLEQSEQIKLKTGVELKLTKIVDKDITTPRPIDIPGNMLSDNIDDIINDSSIDIAVELVGGIDFAYQLQSKLLSSGKNVVTANKALLAEKGSKLYQLARDNNRCIAFEASCAGAIPVVSAIRSGLAANKITAIYGIVNGTCNYILSSMSKKGQDFDTALKKAQQLGFAEADPTLDINGHDSAHKLVIMASFAFGYEFKMDDLYIQGIDGISISDINYASEMGYALKLLAIAKQDRQGQVSLRVHPSFLHKDCALARVDGSFNAISIFGSFAGETMYYGRGAGMMPTASAVVSDIIDVAIGNSLTTFNSFKPQDRAKLKIEDIGSLEGRFYIRLMAKDQSGVFAKYGKILGDNGISISGALQHEGNGPENTVPVIITTHPTREENINRAISELEKSDVISGKVVCIRIVDIPEDDID